MADIYRPFIKAAVVVTLTVGSSLGAINLGAMALGNSVATPWAAITQAHGYAQIFGWVGLFIMGIVYHVLPRLKATSLRGKPAAVLSFWLVLGSVVLRVIAQPLAISAPFGSAVVLSALMELFGASLFAYVCLVTLASSEQPRGFYEKYILASVTWFLITAAATVAISVHMAMTSANAVPGFVDDPYLHVALMGFVCMMIFGFSLRVVPLFLGLQAPNGKAFDVIFWVLNVGIALTASGTFAAADFGPPWEGPALAITRGAAILEYAGVVAFVYFLNIFRRPEVDISSTGVDRGHEKFIRAAYAWLIIAATMALGFTVYQWLTSTEIDYGYVGAYRHALTLGFISMMIIGMSSRMIPVFAGVKLYSPGLLLATFVLINVGNVLRVVSQPLAGELGGIFFATMGLSGFIDLAAFVIFGYNIWKTMDNREETAKKRQTDAVSKTASV